MFDAIKAGIEVHRKMTAGNIMEDGQTRLDHFGTQRRIAQAACNYNGYIVTGTRHYCPIMQMQIQSLGRGVLRAWCANPIQGFTDQFGNFLTREEAYPIAKEAGQIWRYDDSPGVLYSECYI